MNGCRRLPRYQDGTGRILGRRVNNLDARITRKASLVERENLGNAMHLHSSDQPRIMRRLTHHLILEDQSFPSRIDGWRFQQKEKHALDPLEFRRCLSRSQTEAIFSERPSRDHP